MAGAGQRPYSPFGFLSRPVRFLTQPVRWRAMPLFGQGGGPVPAGSSRGHPTGPHCLSAR